MSSKRHVRRKACTGKIHHATQAAAITAARSLYRATGEHLTPYRCRFCHRYHIGHAPARVRGVRPPIGRAIAARAS